MERASRRGRGGADAVRGPLWLPAVPFLEGAEDGQENPTRGRPQGAPLHSAPLPPLRETVAVSLG